MKNWCDEIWGLKVYYSGVWKKRQRGQWWLYFRCYCEEVTYTTLSSKWKGVKNLFLRPVQKAHLVESLPYKHEDFYSVIGSHAQKLVVVAQPCNYNLGRKVETGRILGLCGQPS